MILAIREWRLFIFGVVFVLSMLNHASGEAEKISSHPTRIHGTYIQLWSYHDDWDYGRWRRLFYYFRRLGLKQLIVQWTVYDEADVMPGSLKVGPLETILKLADDAGIRVLVGLGSGPNYWEKIQQPPESVKEYLKYKLQRSSVIAKELFPLVNKHGSFNGWYIPEEIDDVNWRNIKSRRVLFFYLRDLSAHLKKITPNQPVAISCFSNAAMSPSDFEKFWRDLLKTTKIDIILFQDGIGVNKLTFEKLPVYLEAVQKAVEKNDRQLQVVIEIFSQTNGHPVDQDDFQAIPASLSRIKRQMSLSSAYTSNIIAFSVPEYMTPLGGAKARQAYVDYLKR